MQLPHTSLCFAFRSLKAIRPPSNFMLLTSNCKWPAVLKSLENDQARGFKFPQMQVSPSTQSSSIVGMPSIVALDFPKKE